MSNIIHQIETILSHIRPAIQMDGGNIEFVSFDEENGVVAVKLHGACVGCPMSHITLKMGVEAALVDAVEGVTAVVTV